MIKLTAKNGLTLPKTNEYITNDVYKKIKKDLVVINPAYLSCVERGTRPVYKNSAGKYIPIQKMLTFMKEYNNRLELPRGYSYRLSEILKQKIELKYPECTDVRNLIDNKLNIELFDYQTKAVNKLLSKSCGILSSPAASGKTIMGIDIVAKLGLKTLWLVTLDKLAKQAIDSITKFTDCSKEHIGLISQGKYNVGNVFTSAIINTARKYKKQLAKENFGIVIIDECHHTPAKTVYDVLMSLSPQYLYGLSATPKRSDGLDTIIKYMIGPITEVERCCVVETDKIITPEIKIIYTNLLIKTELGLSGSYADFMKALVSDEYRNNKILYEIIKEIIQTNVCLVLSDRVSHCHTLYDKLVKIYPFIEIVSGKTKKSESDKIIRKLEEKKITVLISTYQFLSEGIDLPIVNRLFFTTPFKADIRTTQAVGRVQRKYAGKNAKIFDFVDENRLTKGQLNARLEVYKKLGCNISFERSKI